MRRTSGQTQQRDLSTTWMVRISGLRSPLAKPAPGHCQLHTSRCWSMMERGICTNSSTGTRHVRIVSIQMALCMKILIMRAYRALSMVSARDKRMNDNCKTHRPSGTNYSNTALPKSCKGFFLISFSRTQVPMVFSSTASMRSDKEEVVGG